MGGGAEDVELIAYAWLMGHLLLPFGIHTWGSNSEVFNFLTAVGKRHDTCVKFMFPCAAEEQQTMLRNKGSFCFYKNGNPGLCRVRKVRPLNRDPRADILSVQVDHSFKRTDGEVGTLVKLSSLANIDIQEVWNSLLAMNAVLNSMHSQVQKPFDCELCTRRLVFPRQNKEDGNGCCYWEEARPENCVLHRGGIKLNVHIDGTESTTTIRGTGMEDLLYPEDPSEAWLVSPFGCLLFQEMARSIIC